MSVAAVSAKWGAPLRPNYEVRADCGTAAIEQPGIANCPLDISTIVLGFELCPEDAGAD